MLFHYKGVVVMLYFTSVNKIRFCCLALLFGMVLSMVGCAQEYKYETQPSHKTPFSSNHLTSEGGANREAIGNSASLKSNSGKISQCTRELEALKYFNNIKYNNYKLELGKIKQTSASYLGVANGISEDINDLVRPKLQYALTNLCYRIKNDLSESLIKQVNIHD